MPLAGHLLHFGAGDVIIRRNVFGGHAHGNIVVRGMFQQVLIFPSGTGIHGNLRHTLGAAGNDNVSLAAHDGVGAGGDRLQTGGTETIHCHGGYFVGQSGALRDQTCHIHILHAFRHSASYNDIVNLHGIKLGDFFQNAGQGQTTEVYGIDVGKTALERLAVRAPSVSNDVRIP